MSLPTAPAPIDLAFDQQHVWHPYSSMTAPGNIWPVVCGAWLQPSAFKCRRQ